MTLSLYELIMTAGQGALIGFLSGSAAARVVKIAINKNKRKKEQNDGLAYAGLFWATVISLYITTSTNFLLKQGNVIAEILTNPIDTFFRYWLIIPILVVWYIWSESREASVIMGLVVYSFVLFYMYADESALSLLTATLVTGASVTILYVLLPKIKDIFL